MSATASVIDKSDWPAGPWKHEPDRLEFVCNCLPCLALRNPLLGHWHGYVGVPPDNPLYGLAAYELSLNEGVHGGITFAGRYVPGESECGRWWFGFSCGAGRDLSPGLPRFFQRSGAETAHWITSVISVVRAPEPSEVYRDQSYVISEIESLARQLRALSSALQAGG